MCNAVQQCLDANNILLMRKGNRAFLLLAIALALSDRMIKQLLNTVIAKYRDLSVSRRWIICLSPQLRQIIDLLATNKSRYFAQPRPIIVNCFLLGMANLLIFIHAGGICKVTIQLRLKNGTHFSCYESVPQGYNDQMKLCLTLTWDATRLICGGLKNVYSHPSPRKNRFGSLVKNALHILWARETEHPTYPNPCFHSRDNLVTLWNRDYGGSRYYRYDVSIYICLLCDASVT